MKNVDRGPIVQTTAGRLWGIWESGLAVFRGIPYAAAPVGERRWRATESHPGWMGVREATVHGPIAPQPVGLPHDEVLGTQGRSTRFMDEDCLTLTLWSPGTDDARRPVLVWIHGGGMTTGAGSWDVYSCEEFARNGDLVAVSINYRLGPLGSLYAEEDGGGRGNFWIDDMLAALCWVQDNIAAFGGDPANVTVAGQSGGALSIAYMMGSEAGRGLFRRAILQSMPLGFGAHHRRITRDQRAILHSAWSLDVAGGAAAFHGPAAGSTWAARTGGERVGALRPAVRTGPGRADDRAAGDRRARSRPWHRCRPHARLDPRGGRLLPRA